mgnify:CR=1 FL=1
MHGLSVTAPLCGHPPFVEHERAWYVTGRGAMRPWCPRCAADPSYKPPRGWRRAANLDQLFNPPPPPPVETFERRIERLARAGKWPFPIHGAPRHRAGLRPPAEVLEP